MPVWKYKHQGRLTVSDLMRIGPNKACFDLTGSPIKYMISLKPLVFQNAFSRYNVVLLHQRLRLETNCRAVRM